MDASTPNNVEEYSAPSTVFNFERPVPLLRGPLPAGREDDPSAGQYVLAFRDTQAWASAYRACEHKIFRQCEEGARIGCAISSSNKCKPPWWKAMMGVKASDLKQREQCEESEMADCFAAAKEKCVGFARGKCLNPFRDARIAMKESRLDSKKAVKLIEWASMPERSLCVSLTLIGLNRMGSGLEFAYYRATELVGCDDHVDCILGCNDSNVP